MEVWPVPINLNEINFSNLSFLALVCSLKTLLSVLLEELLQKNIYMSAPDNTIGQISEKTSANNLQKGQNCSMNSVTPDTTMSEQEILDEQQRVERLEVKAKRRMEEAINFHDNHPSIVDDKIPNDKYEAFDTDLQRHLVGRRLMLPKNSPLTKLIGS